MPFHRLSKLQHLCGTPLSASTAWQQCADVWAEVGEGVYEEFLTQAAQGSHLEVDDTGAIVLDVMAAHKAQGKSKSCYTTTIHGHTVEKDPFVLYITDEQTAGKKLGTLLKRRTHLHHNLTLMSDASTMNNIPPQEGEDRLSHMTNGYCMAHGQRKFKDLLAYYPEECGYFIAQIQAIYHNEHRCKHYPARKRLGYHKQHSSPYIGNIYRHIHLLFSQKRVEPNSALGQALRYWVKHKRGLTQFLRVKGMPLDNNRCEESLRAIILQRKNSYFFKSKSSAEVLSGLCSLVKTCEINGVNSFAYLNWLQAHGFQARVNPKAYLPFAYAQMIRESRAPPLQAA